MYNLMCSLIVLMQHLQLNHSRVFIVVSKNKNKQPNPFKKIIKIILSLRV